MTDSNAGQLEKVLFSLFLKGIRDIVLWPYDIRPAYEYIERLSGLGMNIILFDTVRDAPFCDYISVDNRHAIKSLYDCLMQRNCPSVTYIGWDTGHLTSNSEREAGISVSSPAEKTASSGCPGTRNCSRPGS